MELRRETINILTFEDQAQPALMVSPVGYRVTESGVLLWL